LITKNALINYKKYAPLFWPVTNIVGDVAAGIQKEFATEVDEIKIASSGQKKSF